MLRFWWISLLFLLFACHDSSRRMLIVCTEASPEGLSAFQEAAESQGLEVNTVANLAAIDEDTLQQYRTLVLWQLPEHSLSYVQQTDLERFVQAGGGLVSVGTNLAPQYQWPWYQQLASQFGEEAEETLVQKVSTHDEGHSATAGVAFDGGYVALLPNPDEISQDQLSEILAEASAHPVNYVLARSPRVPDASRFTRIVLDNDLNEPMEMDILPDGRVLYIERRGKVFLYNPETQERKMLTEFDVCTEGNYEDGLLGVAVDPKFSQNRRVYFYYSHPVDSVQRLSRFYLSSDSLILSSEKKLLDVPVQRYTCCHSGGSIQFGPDGLLYLSTGDNTSSKESNGYSPLDERPGRGPFDSQKSSGNTHDLRGKILRIRVNDDGSYSIPQGNLFAKDGSEGRPEIYIMGARNPFRITIDPKTNWLYWGDVGPDVGKDGIQGPQSYDEWNQARKPGNYGWPYFVADNKAYPDWDFYTDTPGPYYNPADPVNESPNNYGSKHLPPAQPAMIWYPYSESEQWPNLGTGSRSAMAGPIYYSDQYPFSEVKFPSYYDGKFFIFEWARSWIKVVSFDAQGLPNKIEPFPIDMPLSKPIDMEFGPDGALYVLEYGANYFANNDEARLVKIEYAEGNRNPIAQLTAEQKVGAAPFTVQFSALSSYDYDAEDELSYEWYFSDDKVQSTEAEPTFTFEETGVYTPRLVVKDQEGNTSSAQTEIRVGNAPPQVVISIDGNQSFYFDNQRLNYKVQVSDQEDGSTQAGQIAPEAVPVRFDYLQESKDLALLGSGMSVSPFLKGKQLIDGSDCKSCHALAEKSIGPSYQDVAGRYHTSPDTIISYLANKIITGGNGNWGHSLMAAHPQHSVEETSQMAQYILSLADTNGASANTSALEGTYVLNRHKGENGAYYLSAQYTDQGGNGMPPLTTRKTIALRHPRVQAEDYEEFSQVSRQRPNGGEFAFVSNIVDGAYIGFHDIDLTDIASLTFSAGGQVGGTIEVRLDSAEGALVGQANVTPSEDRRALNEYAASVQPTKGKHDVYLLFRNPEAPDQSLFILDWMYFHASGDAL
uniref:PQQ-dependent sugar dehydrogenase n=1 Tax=Roseihalotalea indica TaxID=2867963 RepID=A0AA49GJD5_9BACT|nr:PQQ-dependent sugar dehydrogenase [Tunicatimonas sp. TK19036]